MRRTGVSVHTLRYYEPGRPDRHPGRPHPTSSPGLTEIQENLETIDHKIAVYRGSLAAGDADRLWAPVRGSQSS